MPEAIEILDSHSGTRAVIAPQLGFNCVSFSAVFDGETVEFLDSPSDVLNGSYRPSSFGIPILFPFPNRIRLGRFEWEGQAYEIAPPPGRDHAIHGFCYDRPWRVTEQSEDSVTGQFQLSVDDAGRRNGWPADFLFDVRYRVAEHRLETQFRVTNPDRVPLPWGLGTHAYFRLPFSKNSRPGNCVFSIPVTEQWELIDSLPTGSRLPVEPLSRFRRGLRFGEARFDDVFTGWESDGGTVRSEIFDEHAGIQLMQVCDAELFTNAVLFTPPDRDALCIEPYTCVTDAINLHSQDVTTGLQVLAPGKTAQTWAVLQASRIMA